MTQKHSLKQFVLLWVFILSLITFLFVYIAFQSFFSKYINESSVKDLKYRSYVAKEKFLSVRRALDDAVATHVTSKDFVKSFSERDYEKVRVLVQNWVAVNQAKEIQIFDSSGFLIDLKKGDPSDERASLSAKDLKKLKNGYSLFKDTATASGFQITISRAFYDEFQNVKGFLQETKVSPFDTYESLMLAKSYFFIATSKRVLHVSEGLSKFSELNLKKALKSSDAFKLKLKDSLFDSLKMPLTEDLYLYILKDNLKSKAGIDFFKKYFLYFMLTLLLVLGLFYFSYYKQIFKPLVAISDFISGKTKSLEQVTLSIKEMSDIYDLVSQKIESLNESLEETREEKNKEVHSLVASVAHELNNSLVALGVNLDFIQDELSQEKPNAEEIAEALKSSQSGYRRIEKIVSDLRVFSSKIEMDIKKYKLKDFVETLSSNFPELEVKTDLSFETEFAADEDRLLQVFHNLIKNSMQSYPLESSNKKVQLSIYTVGRDSIHFDVLDWGKGVPKALQKKIFAPFVTTKKNLSGTGLGLPLSKNLIEDMEGQLYLKESSEIGTTFCIILKRLV